MKDIFSDLYDRVLSFFTSQNDETKVVAKSRLRSVLMQDRVGFSERAMQMLKDDMLDSISKYLEIDIDSFDLSIDAKENTTVLNLSIPVIRPKTDEEIDEAIALAQNEKIKKTHKIAGELEELVKEKAQELAEAMTEEDAKDQQAEVLQEKNNSSEKNIKEDKEELQNENIKDKKQTKTKQA